MITINDYYRHVDISILTIDIGNKEGFYTAPLAGSFSRSINIPLQWSSRPTHHRVVRMGSQW
jgi:hypothetical protein